MQNLDEFEDYMTKKESKTQKKVIDEIIPKTIKASAKENTTKGNNSSVFRIGKDVFPLFEQLYVTERRFSSEINFTPSDFINKLLKFYIDKDFGGRNIDDALKFLEYFESVKK